MRKTNPISPAGTGPQGRGTRGNRAKRSQTWAGWDIWGTAPRGGELCETKPIPGKAGRDEARGTWGEGLIMQNEPNSKRSLRCKVSSVKSGKPGGQPSEGLLLQTSHLGSQTHNSAFGGPFTLSAERRLPRGNRTKRTQFGPPGPVWVTRARKMQNEPNSARPGPSRVPGGRKMRNKANSPAVEGQSCETNPISLVGRGPRGRNAQNEPNFRRSFKCYAGEARPGSGADCAKRTQFAAAGPGRVGRIVQNEANFGSSRPKGLKPAAVCRP
jgi:hypothetical protein